MGDVNLCQLYLQDVRIESSSAKGDGGAVRIDQGNQAITFDNVHISGAISEENGGCISLQTSMLLLNRTTLMGCAAEKGGAIDVFNSDIQIYDSFIFNSSATDRGGAVRAFDAVRARSAHHASADTYPALRTTAVLVTAPAAVNGAYGKTDLGASAAITCAELPSHPPCNILGLHIEETRWLHLRFVVVGPRRGHEPCELHECK